MTLSEYIESKQSRRKIPAEIVRRWFERVVANQYHLEGEQGARSYITYYGRRISEDKLVKLARCAQAEGAPDIALGFWKMAYKMSTGEEGSLDGELPVPENAPVQIRRNDDWPDIMVPGRFITTQPMDAPQPVDFYIDSDDWLGQPKRDGHRAVAFVTADKVQYQSRNLMVYETVSQLVDDRLKSLAREFGPMVLDGEVWWAARDNREHRTQSQADAANQDGGYRGSRGMAVYSIFKPLYIDGRNLLEEPERVRMAAQNTYFAGMTLGNGYVEPLFTHTTRGMKKSLLAIQKGSGKEGEIWIHKDTTYVPGKNPYILRTKHLKIGLFEVFGIQYNEETESMSLKLGLRNGSSIPEYVGSVRSGFTEETIREILRMQTDRTICAEVIFSGFTEYGKLLHPRFWRLRGYEVSHAHYNNIREFEGE